MICIILVAGHAFLLEEEIKKSTEHEELAGIPKALLPGVGGKKILDFWWDTVRQGKLFTDIYLVTNADKYKHYERWASASGFPIENIINDGTTTYQTRLGAVADVELVVWTKNIRDDVMVVAGDMLFQDARFDLGQVVRFFKSKGNGDVAVYYQLGAEESTHTRGIIDISPGSSRIEHFWEKPVELTADSRLASVVFYCFQPDTLDNITIYLNSHKNVQQRSFGQFMEWLINDQKSPVYGMHLPSGFKLIGQVGLQDYLKWRETFSLTQKDLEADRAREAFSKRAYARVGLMGNPSDGFNGKTISMSIANFWADVTIKESDTLVLTPHPLNDPTEFGGLVDLHGISEREGYLGGLRLLQATCKHFMQYCLKHKIKVPKRNFTLKYDTNIPRQVGLAGSSAIVVATLNCLMEFFHLDADDIPKPLQPQFVLDVEKDELLIQAGLQDRVIQIYEGLVYMDFSKELFEQQGHGTYIKLPVCELPRFWLAYSVDASDSGRIHSNVSARWHSGDPEVMGAMKRFAALTDRARVAIGTSNWTALAQLMNDNFALRRHLYGDAALGKNNLKMVDIARQFGSAVKFPGSGGAVFGLCLDSNAMTAMKKAMQSEGFVVCDIIPNNVLAVGSDQAEMEREKEFATQEHERRLRHAAAHPYVMSDTYVERPSERGEHIERQYSQPLRSKPHLRQDDDTGQYVRQDRKKPMREETMTETNDPDHVFSNYPGEKQCTVHKVTVSYKSESRQMMTHDADVLMDTAALSLSQADLMLTDSGSKHTEPPEHVPSTNMPEHIPSTNMPEHIPSTNVQRMPSTNVPEHIPSNDMIERMPNINVQYMPSYKFVQHVPSTNMPEQIPSTNIPEHVPSNNVQHVPSTNMPERIPSTNIPEHMPSNNVQYVPSTNTPERIPSTNLPEHVPSNNVQYVPSTNMPERIPSTNIPEHVPSNNVQYVPSTNKPEHIPSTNIPEHVPSNNVQYVPSTNKPEHIPSTNMPEHMSNANIPEHMPGTSIPPSATYHSDVAETPLYVGTRCEDMLPHMEGIHLYLLGVLREHASEQPAGVQVYSLGAPHSEAMTQTSQPYISREELSTQTSKPWMYSVGTYENQAQEILSRVHMYSMNVSLKESGSQTIPAEMIRSLNQMPLHTDQVIPSDVTDDTDRLGHDTLDRSQPVSPSQKSLTFQETAADRLSTTSRQQVQGSDRSLNNSHQDVMAHDRSSTNSHQHILAPDRSSTNSRRHTLASDRSPNNSHQSVLASDRSSTNSHQHILAPDRSSTNSRRHTLASDRSPNNSHQSVLASDRSPNNSHQSVLASDRSSTYYHQNVLASDRHTYSHQEVQISDKSSANYHQELLANSRQHVLTSDKPNNSSQEVLISARPSAKSYKGDLTSDTSSAGSVEGELTSKISLTNWPEKGQASDRPSSNYHQGVLTPERQADSRQEVQVFNKPSPKSRQEFMLSDRSTTIFIKETPPSDTSSVNYPQGHGTFDSRQDVLSSQRSTTSHRSTNSRQDVPSSQRSTTSHRSTNSRQDVLSSQRSTTSHRSTNSRQDVLSSQRSTTSHRSTNSRQDVMAHDKSSTNSRQDVVSSPSNTPQDVTKFEIEQVVYRRGQVAEGNDPQTITHTTVIRSHRDLSVKPAVVTQIMPASSSHQAKSLSAHRVDAQGAWTSRETLKWVKVEDRKPSAETSAQRLDGVTRSRELATDQDLSAYSVNIIKNHMAFANDMLNRLPSQPSSRPRSMQPLSTSRPEVISVEALVMGCRIPEELVVPQLVAPLAAAPPHQSSSSSSSNHSLRHDRVMAVCEPCPTTQASGSHRRLPTPRDSQTNRVPVSDSDSVSDWMAHEECLATRHSASKFRGIKMAVDTDDDYYLNDDDALDNTYNPDEDYDSDILHCMSKIKPKSTQNVDKRSIEKRRMTHI